MVQLQMNCRYDAESLSVGFGELWFDGSDIEMFIRLVLESEAVGAAEHQTLKCIDWELSDV